MRSAFRGLVLAGLFASAVLPVHADPLVRVDLYGEAHHGDYPVSYSFTFDAAAYHSYAPPFYDQDFVYTIPPLSIFGPQRTVDTLDFFLGGDGMALYTGDAFSSPPAYSELLYFQFQPGSCQVLPAEPLSGAAPVFVSKKCSPTFFSEQPTPDPLENVLISEVDFTVESSTITPEPSTFMLLGSGLLACGSLRRQRRR